MHLVLAHHNRDVAYRPRHRIWDADAVCSTHTIPTILNYKRRTHYDQHDTPKINYRVARYVAAVDSFINEWSLWLWIP